MNDADNLDCRLGGCSRRFFRSLALSLNLKSENQGRKRALVASAGLRLKGALRGLVFASVALPFFRLKNRKRKTRKTRPPLPIARGCPRLAGRRGFVSSGRGALVGLSRGFVVACLARKNSPGRANRKPLESPCRLLPLLSSRKLAPPSRSPAAPRRGLVFSRLRAS